jgi:hypothetical protein
MKNVMSPEGRAKIVAAQKARWAKKKALAKAKAPAVEPQPETDLPAATPEQEAAIFKRFEAPFIPLHVAPRGDPKNPITECFACGWSDTDSTFVEAITKHGVESPDCKRPCLTHPSKAVIKKRALREIAKTGRKVI